MLHKTQTVSLSFGMKTISIVTAILGVMTLFGLSHVKAATTITVNSTADTTVNDGQCTFREAIIASNSDTASGAAVGECIAGSGTDTIAFNISEPADFTNDGQNGYTIQPTTALPFITQTVIIDGFTQPGAQENTTTAPAPFDAIMLIQLDGSATVALANGLQVEAANTEIKGLVINGFTTDGISVCANNVKITGNYIGTDPTGSTAVANESRGIGGLSATGDNAVIGGIAPEDRNIISGNDALFDTNGIAIDGDHNGWTIEGNYIGVAADGLTALPNSAVGGFPAIAITDSTGLTIGGSTIGATNVIAGNNNFVLDVNNADDLTIQGNYFGVDYSGASILSNVGNNLDIKNSTNVTIGGSNVGEGNVITGSNGNGITLNNATNVVIQGNSIGSGIDRTEDLGNVGTGILVAGDSTDILVGGSTAGAGNTIAHNGQLGVLVTGNAVRVSILSNSIYDNNGLGVDLIGDGITSNDSGDGDNGPNDLLNYPEITYSNESGGNTTIAYHVDVPAGQYRVEFFDSSIADLSGNGEGEEFLDAMNITSPGGLASFMHTFTGVTGINNLSMTITEITETQFSFGATSEFSDLDLVTPVSDLSVAKILTNPGDVAPGATLNYDVTVTNNGPDPLDLAQLIGDIPGLNNVFLDILPPELEFVSGGATDIACTSFGPGSASLFGSALGDHLDHTVIVCDYTGGNQLLVSGDSITVPIEVTVANDSDLVFTNFVMVTPNVSNDPDGSAFNDAVNLGDFLTQLNGVVNNVAGAQYPESSNPSENGGAGDGASGGINGGGSLSLTGQDWRVASCAIFMSAVIGLLYTIRIRLHTTRRHSNSSR